MKPDAAADYLLSILGGKARVQAISTVAALGVADRLAEGPRTVESLATELGCAVAVLAPLLRLVAGLGFFDSPQPGSYALTELGAVLKKDALGPFAAFVGAREQWDPWSALREAACDGGVAFVKTYGMGLYEFLAREPAAAARYDAAIDAFTKHEADVLCAQFDFGAASRVVDVGGGRGTLLASILQRWEHLHGVLFDLPHVADRARPELEERFGARVRVQAGDFFTDLPAGADVHLLRHVLHNWNDEQALHLLRQCAAAIVPGGRVLVIETILAPDNRADLACMLDLEMMVLTGGRERRRPELRRLLTAAGLAIERTVPMTSGSWLLVGVRAPSG